MLEVARTLGGLHAQLMSSAELTSWARVEDLEPDQIRTALWRDHTLIKTWAMRGTLHLLPADEFLVWQTALATQDRWASPVWLRWLEITEKDLKAIVAAVDKALDGRELTRQELAREVGRITRKRALGEKLLGGWGSLLKPAAFAGKLCFAPSSGTNVRFTRPDRWVDQGERPAPDAALAEVTRRFFSAYGPATRADLARWWGVVPPRANRMLESLGDELVPVEVDGLRALMLADDADEAVRAQPVRTVRLLPAFDLSVVATPPATPPLLAPDLKPRVYRKSAWFSAVVLVDGRIVGVWRHERKGKSIAVAVEPFENPSPKTRKAVATEAEKLAGFLGGRLSLSWS